MADHPEATALDDGRVTLDYRALAAEVGSLAARLHAAGVGAGDRVGVRVPSGTADLYVAILGVLTAGAAYVPVDVDDPDQRAELVWSQAGVYAVLSAGLALATRPGVVPDGEERRPRPDDDAWVIFTSGSTGKPKGVAISHRSAAAFVDAEATLFVRERPLGPGDRVLAGLSVGFDASCEEMWLAWRHGGCLMPGAAGVGPYRGRPWRLAGRAAGDRSVDRAHPGRAVASGGHRAGPAADLGWGGVPGRAGGPAVRRYP